LTGRTLLSFGVAGDVERWAWSSSRPGAVRFERGPVGAMTLVAGEPGALLVRMAVGEKPDAQEEASILVSVPMFVRVDADVEVLAMLRDELGLSGREGELIAEAKRALDAIFSAVNVRVAFHVGLGEDVPAELPEGGFIEATIHGSLRGCVTPRSSLLSTEFGGYAEGDSGKRLLRAPVHVCPAIFARHPDTMAAMVKNRARLLADDRSARLYTTIVGRALGELLAHEIGHQLLGCDMRGERRFWRCHDRLPKSLMNKAGERSFSDRTGVTIVPTATTSYWRDDFPDKASYEDGGVDAINRLPPEGQAVLDRILPVPPALREVAPCL
jgi:hypothetical protein